MALAWDLALETVAMQETQRSIKRDADQAKRTKDMRFPVYDMGALQEW